MIQASEAKQVSRATASLLFSQLDVATKSNGRSPSEDCLEVLARSVFDGDVVHTTAKERQLARGEAIELQQRSPLAKSHLYHLRNPSSDAIEGSTSNGPIHPHTGSAAHDI